MTQKVLDYSYARFSPAQVHSLGAVAVCRYLTVVTPNTKGKLLTHAGGRGILGRRDQPRVRIRVRHQ